MLQIKLKSKGGPSTEGGVGEKSSAGGEATTLACPDHLTIANLPVAKTLGSVPVATVVKTVGRKARPEMGERVHICVRCDFPIAIYGRLIRRNWYQLRRKTSVVNVRGLSSRIHHKLSDASLVQPSVSPCYHAFCLDCAKTDPTCYLCDESIQKIQTMKVNGGIWICAATKCLKSFLKKDEFDSHVLKNHGDLLVPCPRKEESYESEAASASRPPSVSTVQAPRSCTQLNRGHTPTGGASHDA